MTKAQRYRAAHKLEISIRQRAWGIANKIKRKAHQTVQSAVKRGDVIRPKSCPRCGGTKRIEAHHPDYTKPLQIEWLCRKCHFAEHGKPKFYSTVKKRFKGAQSPTAKLTEQQARDAITMHKSGLWTLRAIGRHFAVDESTIRLLLKGKTWAHLFPKVTEQSILINDGAKL